MDLEEVRKTARWLAGETGRECFAVKTADDRATKADDRPGAGVLRPNRLAFATGHLHHDPAEE
jgi:hypothetical protein